MNSLKRLLKVNQGNLNESRSSLSGSDARHPYYY